MKYSILLFDLDGTLTDPKEGITKAVKYALEHFGIVEKNEEKLLAFIGPPLIDGFMDFYGFNMEDAIVAREKYREYYSEKGVLENNVYEGIIPLLEKMKSLGKRLLVATSKPVYYAEIILKHFGIFDYFEAVCGAEFNEKQHKKIDVINKAIAISGNLEKSSYLMIGDRKHDLIAANEAKIDCACVLFGYGSLEEFTPYEPKYIVDSVRALEELLVNL